MAQTNFIHKQVLSNRQNSTNWMRVHTFPSTAVHCKKKKKVVFHPLTVRACIATWGSLWFTLLMTERRHSLGLSQRKKCQMNQKRSDIPNTWWWKCAGALGQQKEAGYPVRDCPILSHMSRMRPQSSAVFISLVAFSAEDAEKTNVCSPKSSNNAEGEERTSQRQAGWAKALPNTSVFKDRLWSPFDLLSTCSQWSSHSKLCRF